MSSENKSSKDKDKFEKLYKRVLEKRHKEHLEKIKKQQESDLNEWKKFIFEELDSNLTPKEKIVRQAQMLKFIKRYFFVNKLLPLSSQFLEQPEIIRKDYLNRVDSTKRYIQYLVDSRSFINKLPSFKGVFLVISALGFLFCEYYFHYYTSFSLKDVNIEFEDIIKKFPPFR